MSARPVLRLVEGGAPEAETLAPPRHRDALEMLAVGAGLVLTLTLAAALPSWREDLPRFQALMAVAFAFFALALWRMPRWRSLPYAGIAVFAVALSARLALLPAVPSLSDDIYRYIWEGRVLAHGANPWASAPDDPVLASLRDEDIHPRVNHPDLRTIYPPVAEVGFALVAAWSPTVPAMKTWILAHDLAIVALLLWVCGRRSGSPLGAIVWAWNPLVLAEYAGSGHHDPTALVWLLLAVILADRRPLLSAASLVLGVGVKLLPVLAIPFLWRRWTWPARAVALAGSGLMVGTLIALSRGPGSGVDAYAAHWRNNDLLFGAVLALVRSETWTRIALALAVGGFVLWRARRSGPPWRGVREGLRATLLASPVVHPWYLGWALLFEPLGPSAPWLVASATVLLAYGTFATPAGGGAFHLGLGGRSVEYGLPALVAVALAIRGRRRRLARV